MDILKRTFIIALCLGSLVACNSESEDVKLARDLMKEMEAGKAAELAYIGKGDKTKSDPATKAAKTKAYCEKKVAKAIATKTPEQLEASKNFSKTCFEYYP
ncbi:MAG: hypothetical protein JKY52_08900 [Flavobacteriales bacterium]|nr:hypothetical protein [Flavobacteriales bacterium]